MREIQSLETRFWKRVLKKGPDDCWLWQGTTATQGYGTITRGGRGEGLIRAHRFSYELVKGPVPEGLVVMHLCNTKACVNPAHLKAGTYAENNAAAWKDGLKTFTPERRDRLGHFSLKLSFEQAGEIRRLYPAISMKALAKRFKVSVSAIHAVLSGRTRTRRLIQES